MIRVVFPSFQIHCDTADEAFTVANRFLPGQPNASNGHGADHGVSSNIGTRWTGNRLQNFWTRLNDKEKRAITELHTNSDGVPVPTLRQILGLSSGLALGSILSGISHKAKLVGVSFEDVIESEKVTLSNGQKVRELRIVPSFRSVASEAGVLKPMT